ncbi:unnamed protein product, partial [Closterium sp. Yama58-4]
REETEREGERVRAPPSYPAVTTPSHPTATSHPVVASHSHLPVASPSHPAIATTSHPAAASSPIPPRPLPPISPLPLPSPRHRHFFHPRRRLCFPPHHRLSFPLRRRLSFPLRRRLSFPPRRRLSFPPRRRLSFPPAVAPPSLPAVASPSLSAVASPSLSAVASPSLPTVASPSLPAIASPSLSAVASPSLPAVASPSLPAVVSGDKCTSASVSWFASTGQCASAGQCARAGWSASADFSLRHRHYQRLTIDSTSAMASWQLSVLTLCSLASLLTPAAARPTKEDFIDELKKTRDALEDSKLNGRYSATHTLLNHVIPQLETDWNPNEDFLNKVDHKTFMLPEDRAIASSAPDALAMMVKTGLKRGDVDPFTKLFRAQMLDAVYEEDDLAKASEDVNGRSVGTDQIVDATTKSKKVAIGKGKAKVKNAGIFRERFLTIHGVDASQPEE